MVLPCFHACYKDHYKWVIFATFLDVWHLNGDIKIGSIEK